jgi:potassium efflux system protein
MTSLLTTLLYTGRILSAMLLALLLIFTATATAGLTELIPTTPAEQPTPVIKESEQQKISIPNLITYTTKLSEKLIDLQSQLADITSAVDVAEELPKIETALESLNWDAMMQQADSNLSYKKITDTVLLLNEYQNDLNDIAEPLNKAIKILAKQEESWHGDRDTLTKWVETLNNKKAFPLLQQNITDLQQSIESAIETIDSRMSDTLIALHTISGLQVKLYNLKVTADDLLADLLEEGLQQTSPSIFSHKFYSVLSPDLLLMAWQNARTGLEKESRQIRANINTLLLILIFPILISIVLIMNRSILKKHKNWSLLSSHPIAFSVFTSLMCIFPWLGTAMMSLYSLLTIVVIFSVMMLAGELRKKSVWVVRFIYALSFFLVLNMLVDLINLPLPLRRIYLLVTCCCWLAYSLWRTYSSRGDDRRYRMSALLVINLALTVIIFADIFGYDELAGYLFRGVFKTLFIFISAIILFNTSTILFEVLLSLLPKVRRHSDVIVRALRPLIVMLCILFFYILIAEVWHIYTTPREAFSALVGLGFSQGDNTWTLNMIFLIIGIFYGAIMISRATQAILLDEVLPRYKIDMGVQLSISRLVHYAILFIGGLVLIKVMGANLTKLTIFGGALSVGIGFGLQAIVNNFASGLILLFERPIKVGDTIEVGTDMGEVKKLGLRSTIIQTFDNAEIVIPNSDLIAGQVTNWTLAERKARLKLPVGVAYGSDIPKVLEILLTVANEHPMILTTPPPSAFFLAFGASSLDFELRVWIADFSDRRLVQSELNQEIDSEFADAGIEIPFPQTDLHLRTVDNEAAEALRSQGATAEA